MEYCAMRSRPRPLAILLCGLACGCLASSTADLPHHGPEGFRNNHPHEAKQSFWKWKWRQWVEGVAQPPAGGWRIPHQPVDVREILRSSPSITWLGHAGFLVQAAGHRVLFDPHLTLRASPVSFAGPRRANPVPIEVEDLPHVDAVAISHNHYDHLDLETVQRLARRPGGGPLFLVPLGLKSWFHEQGIERVVELDWWETREIASLRFTLVPVQHWSKRTPWDANRSLWGGWVLDAAGLRIIHTGDLGYSRDVAEVGERMGPFDLALIPIGAYAPRWFMRAHHVDVAEAVAVRRDLRALRAIGMHWGTFLDLTDEALDEPPQELQRIRELEGLPPEAFDTMMIGETRPIRPLRGG